MSTAEHRFFAKVTPVADCWEFTSLRHDGYGFFWFQGATISAHRWSYEFLRAEIPTGLHLDHLCRNRACVNPWHLEPVTARVNTLRGQTIPATNTVKEVCPAGHGYEGDNLRVTPTGKRVCRTCHRINAARSRARSAA